MVIMPLELLRYHIQQTCQRLSKLIEQVEEVESNVADGLPTTDFEVLVRKLHSCNAELLKLERRWHFEDQLASSIQKFIDGYKQPRALSQNIDFTHCNIVSNEGGAIKFQFSNEGREETLHASKLQDEKYFKKLDSDSALQSRLSRTSEYDLKVLPRRISNQFTAVRPLQRALHTYPFFLLTSP